MRNTSSSRNSSLGESVIRAAAAPDPALVSDYLWELSGRVSDGLEREEPEQRFVAHPSVGPQGNANPRVLSGGTVLEKAAVLYTHSRGSRLPPAATERRPHLSGRAFEAISLSVIVHPRNPYVPTTHLNLRAFFARSEAGDVDWWFGGGFDLTPFYPFEEDVIHWHEMARRACQPFGAELYARLKRNCDEYFWLEHRREARGVGGLFFDDFAEGGFTSSFALLRSVGEHFLLGYLPLLHGRKEAPFGERERAFQLHRRSRYVEFNLLYDRGTRYGLQSGRRIESVLASLPPLAAWADDPPFETGSPEGLLRERFLEPRDWLLGSSDRATSMDVEPCAEQRTREEDRHA